MNQSKTLVFWKHQTLLQIKKIHPKKCHVAKKDYNCDIIVGCCICNLLTIRYIIKVRKCGRGLIFSANDFANIGEPKSVRKNEDKAAVEKIIH